MRESGNPAAPGFKAAHEADPLRRRDYIQLIYFTGIHPWILYRIHAEAQSEFWMPVQSMPGLQPSAFLDSIRAIFPSRHECGTEQLKETMVTPNP
jgi:hypothetical protein